MKDRDVSRCIMILSERGCIVVNEVINIHHSVRLGIKALGALDFLKQKGFTIHKQQEREQNVETTVSSHV